MISEANFLLLDEPTNHLDFISENILIQALQQYKGSFVVVSHNRHFVSQIANKIWYIEDKQIKEYPGTYEEYEYWRKKNEENATPKAEIPKPKAEKKQDAVPKTPSNETQLKNLEKELKKIEEQIDVLQRTKTSLENEMAKPEVYGSFERLRTIQEEFEKVNQELNAANTRWDSVAGSIDQIGKKN